MAQANKIVVEDTELYSSITNLPDDLKKEVTDFAEFLLQKAKAKKEKPIPKFGALKGMFVMADDYDEPLEDFKDICN